MTPAERNLLLTVARRLLGHVEASDLKVTDLRRALAPFDHADMISGSHLTVDAPEPLAIEIGATVELLPCGSDRLNILGITIPAGTRGTVKRRVDSGLLAVHWVVVNHEGVPESIDVWSSLGWMKAVSDADRSPEPAEVHP
jgi:hypothetical protein